MRTAISLLVTSFVFGSLAVNFSGFGNSLANGMLFTFGEQELLLARVNPRECEKNRERTGCHAAPHRGSGRRDFV